MTTENNPLLAEALRSGFSWQGEVLTYSVPVQESSWVYQGEPDSTAYDVLSKNQAERFREAIAVWDDVIALDFKEVQEPQEVGQVRIAFADLDHHDHEVGHAYYPVLATEATSGDVWLDDALQESDFHQGGFDYGTLVHELGHVLGLKHPHEPTSRNDDLMPEQYDDLRYTVMSYQGQAERYQLTFHIREDQQLTYDIGLINPDTPMLLDVLTAQQIYGADMTTRQGDDTYRWDADAAILTTIWDADGVDTLDASNHERSIINLQAGSYSSIGVTSVEEIQAELLTQYANYPAEWIAEQLQRFADKDSLYLGNDNVAIAFNVTIENAIGGRGDDILNGNEADNHLQGGAGNDRFSGSAGNDRLDGGLGYDTAVYSGQKDQAVLSMDSDVWQVQFGDETDTLLGIESLVFDDQVFFDSAEARQVYRLYKAAFGRDPEQQGLQYWVGEYLTGGSLYAIAEGFVKSTEFQQLYAIDESRTFLDGLYGNVLQREADTAGRSYWHTELERGFTEADMLIAFSEGQENQQNLAPLIDDGFWLA